MFIQRKTHKTGYVDPGTDIAVAWSPLIPGAKVHSVTGEFHLIGPPTGTQDGGVTVNDTHKFHAAGFGGELVPLTDPEASQNMDALWDQMVTKATPMTTSAPSGGLVSYDFDSAYTPAQIELGMVDVNQLTGLEHPTKEILTPTYEFTSFAKGRQGGYESATDADSPNDQSYTPTMYKTFRGRPVVADDMPAYALIAISSPDFAEEQAFETNETSPATWQIWSHLRDAMADVWKLQTAGMISSGNEGPYDDISMAVETLIAPEIIQPSAANIIGIRWTYLCTATWILEFPDASTPRMLKAF